MSGYYCDYTIPETDVRVRLRGEEKTGPLRSDHPDFRASIFWCPDNGYRAWLGIGRIAVLSPRHMTASQALDYCCNRLRTIRSA